MSAEQTNGDGPQNLKNAYAVMRGEVRRIKRAVRRGRIHIPSSVSMAKLPRSICSLCSRVWDFAMIPENSLPSHGICSDCKAEMANGFTAFACPGKAPIWVKSPALKLGETSNRIRLVTPEEYEMLWKRMNPDVSNQ